MIEKLRSAFQADFATEEGGIIQAHDVTCSIWMSCVEVYEEKLYDLLDFNLNQQQQQPPQIRIMTNSDKEKFIDGIKKIYVASALDAYKVYMHAQDVLQRHISSTMLNEQSSRSHSIFQFTLVREYKPQQRAIVSNLSFCDLAGGERIEKSRAMGVRLDEAKRINKSLLSLGRCLRALMESQM